MQWTTFVLEGRTLTHVEQDASSNQCVAASLAMVCKNAGYSGHRFGEGSLFSQGTSAMRSANPTLPTGMTDLAFITQYGVRHNAIALYLRGYGFANVRTVTLGNDGANALANAINNIGAGESAILACGVDAFHALATFKLGNTIYILDPMPQDDEHRGVAYTSTPAVQALNHGALNAAVRFADPPSAGAQFWRDVDSCYLIPSQWYLGTVKRWLFG